MSFIFIPQQQKPPHSPDIQETIEKMLNENSQLIQIIQESQQRGKLRDCMEYQKVLHRNIVYLAKLADSSTNEHASLSAQVNQLGSGFIDEVNQVQSSGQCGNLGQISNQMYVQQQLNFPMQGQQMMNPQSIVPHSQPVMQHIRSGCMSEGAIEQVTEQQPLMAQEHSVLSAHRLGMAQSSTPGAVSDGSVYGVISHPVGQQDGYCSTQQGMQHSNQHGCAQLLGYTQQQQFGEQQQQTFGQQQQTFGQQQQTNGQYSVCS